MDNEELYEEALEAIMILYEDKSVSVEKAIENLRSLVSEIHLLINSLR